MSESITTAMQHVITRFDDLPVDVLLEIFGYLSVSDCFDAFSSLNRHITSALQLTNLSVDLTAVSNRTLKEFYQEKIFEQHARQIRQLKLSNDLTFDLIEEMFRRWDLVNLKQLRSLTLIKASYMTLGSLVFLLPRWKQLQHLAIDSPTYPMNFFETVIKRAPWIKSCSLPDFEIDSEITTVSSIERLTIAVQTRSHLFNLLKMCPELKYLDVTIKATPLDDEDDSTSIDRIPCSKLETFKLRIPSTSEIQFDEIIILFDRIMFNRLRSLSYYCSTRWLNHFNPSHWTEILSSFDHPLERFEYLIEIPFDPSVQVEIEQRIEHVQQQAVCPFDARLTMDNFYFLIHSAIFPRTSLNLSDGPTPVEQLNCGDSGQYSRVRSLAINCDSINDQTKFPAQLNELYLLGDYENFSFSTLFSPLAHRLQSLKLNSFPHELPVMKELKHLTIQRTMFNLSMVDRIVQRCPKLELLTIETEYIEKFRFIIDAFHQSSLTDLKYLRVFSRDPQHTWSDWLNENKESLKMYPYTQYRASNLFLFVWF